MSHSEFSVDPFLYDGAVYDAVNTFDDDVPFYRKWALAARGTVLELCCGTGRLTLPLAQAGVPITGVDAARSMLDRARDKAQKGDVSIEFIESDIRAFHLKRIFRMIMVPFNSLQGIYDVSDLEVVLRLIRDHLEDNGWLIFDLFNPDFRLMLSRSEKPHYMGTFALDDGRTMIIHDRCNYDALHQVNRAEWIIDMEGEVSVRRLDVRCYYPQEILALLKYNGFEVRHHFGDFDETPFSSHSGKQIFVCTVKSG